MSGCRSRARHEGSARLTVLTPTDSRALVELDLTRMCALLVGLPDVVILGIDDGANDPLRIHVETRTARPVCEQCSSPAWVKDRPVVELVDLPCVGRATRFVWH